MINILSIAAGMVLLAEEKSRTHITVVNATSEVMEDVVLEVIHKPSTQPEEVRTILGDLPVGRQIKTKMNGSDQIETALVRYRIDGMENTFSCGPVAAGESLIMTNDNKGVTCDFQ